jgi:hypothetical protein
VVTQLTSLNLCRSQGPSPAAAAAAAPAPPTAAAAPGAPPPMPAAPPALPGAVPQHAAGAAGGGAGPADGADFPRLPPALARLPRLRALRLENLPPSYDVLQGLSSLERLEMRVRRLGLGLRNYARRLRGCAACAWLLCAKPGCRG